MDTTLFEEIADLFTTRFRADSSKIRPEVRLVADLGFDSLDEVDLVRALEKTFSIDISNDEQASLSTIGDVVALVSEKGATAATKGGADQ